MIIAFCDINPLEPNSDSSNMDKTTRITDVLGIGKAIESFANSFGKLLEKIPTNKLTAGMSFVVVIMICVMIFVGAMLYIDSDKSFIVIILVLLFSIVCVAPFIILEFMKEHSKINKKDD